MEQYPEKHTFARVLNGGTANFSCSLIFNDFVPPKDSIPIITWSDFQEDKIIYSSNDANSIDEDRIMVTLEKSAKKIVTELHYRNVNLKEFADHIILTCKFSYVMDSSGRRQFFGMRGRMRYQIIDSNADPSK